MLTSALPAQAIEAVLRAHSADGAAPAGAFVEVPGRVEDPQEGAPPLRLPAIDVLRAVAQARGHLIESLADLDEALGEAYLSALDAPAGGGGGSSAEAVRAAALAPVLGIEPAHASLGFDASLPGLTPANLR